MVHDRSGALANLVARMGNELAHSPPSIFHAGINHKNWPRREVFAMEATGARLLPRLNLFSPILDLRDGNYAINQQSEELICFFLPELTYSKNINCTSSINH